MLAEMTAGQPSRGGSRPVPIGSRSIGVSLQPAIPRRVAPQQSPLPLHQSPTILAQSPSGEAITYAARFHWGRARRPVANGECHLYFARSVSFLYCSDIAAILIKCLPSEFGNRLMQTRAGAIEPPFSARANTGDATIVTSRSVTQHLDRRYPQNAGTTRLKTGADVGVASPRSLCPNRGQRSRGGSSAQCAGRAPPAARSAASPRPS